MKNIGEILVNNVRQLYVASKLTQQEFADKADVHINTIQSLLSPKNKYKPRMDILPKLSKALGVEPYQLLMEDPYAIEPKPAPPPPTISELARELTAANDKLAAFEAARARWDQTAQEAANRILELESQVESLQSKLELVTKPIETSDNHISKIAEKIDTSSERNEKDTKRYLEPQLVTNQGENVTYPPEILRALADPSMLEDVIELIHHLEAEKAHLEPASKRKS